MSRWPCLFLAFVLVSSLSLPAAAAARKCTGRFVNPITDICWSCLFPLSVGSFEVWPSNRPDPKNPELPVCYCPPVQVGVAMGFWEPIRLADVSMKPWCFVNLGGLSLNPGFDIGHKHFAGPSIIGGQGQNTGGWHVHWYVYPLIYWLELLTDFACMDEGAVDIAYVSEVDPLWQDSELATIINPEAVLFANPLATAACAADCVASTRSLPRDELSWCAGCLGTMYPMNGNIPAQLGHVQGSRLALSRFIYKLHRQSAAEGTMGAKGLCSKYPMPVLRRQQYRLQAVNPNPQTSGRYACAPIGASPLLYGSGQMTPVIGEDFGYLVWRKRNCCVL